MQKREEAEIREVPGTGTRHLWIHLHQLEQRLRETNKCKYTCTCTENNSNKHTFLFIGLCMQQASEARAEQRPLVMDLDSQFKSTLQCIANEAQLLDGAVGAYDRSHCTCPMSNRAKCGWIYWFNKWNTDKCQLHNYVKISFWSWRVHWFHSFANAQISPEHLQWLCLYQIRHNMKVTCNLRISYTVMHHIPNCKCLRTMCRSTFSSTHRKKTQMLNKDRREEKWLLHDWLFPSSLTCNYDLDDSNQFAKMHREGNFDKIDRRSQMRWENQFM